MLPRVLFVSKPIAPPWNDGSKNLVRDVATHLSAVAPSVMVPRADAPSLAVRTVPVYANAGGFSPALQANARVLRYLIGSGNGFDAWHFVFAPNKASSFAARFARKVARFRGSVFQTIPSAAKDFSGIAPWIFGDEVIAMSEWTRMRLREAGVRASVSVIPPCALRPPPASNDERSAFRESHRIPPGPIVLYPGDYEVSSGAQTVADASLDIVQHGATVVFACRKKTPAAAEAESALVSRVRDAGCLEQVRFLGDVPKMSTLLWASDLVVFPVDNLYGKVDLPLVLLEAMSIGKPIVLADYGPLREIKSATFVPPGDSKALASQVGRFLSDRAALKEAGEAAENHYVSSYTPERIAAEYDALYARVLRL